ncbi:MAG: MerR family transcriptional regulator [Alphaproteobacteria bacterium]|nr:MerR family transcriptional regulator [Alphaproteobacteria bacterium]
MRIGELSKKAGVSRDTIRFYEKQGLLQCQAREAENNYKSYPEDAIMTIAVIRDAQAAGMSIGDLTVFLSQLYAAYGDGFDGDAFLKEKIQETEERVAASARFLEVLKQTRTALKIAPYEAE